MAPDAELLNMNAENRWTRVQDWESRTRVAAGFGITRRVRCTSSSAAAVEQIEDLVEELKCFPRQPDPELPRRDTAIRLLVVPLVRDSAVLARLFQGFALDLRVRNLVVPVLRPFGVGHSDRSPFLRFGIEPVGPYVAYRHARKRDDVSLPGRTYNSVRLKGPQL